MNVQHIFFDLDHTLWDFEKNSDLTFQKIFKEYYIDLSLNSFLEKYKPINKGYWELYQENKVSKKDLRYFRLKDTFDVLEYSISDHLITEISIKYIDYLPFFNHLFEGTIQLLEDLKMKYQLHIITNGFEEVQLLKMEKSGLLPYFNQIITSESVGVKKPNPKIFHHALKLANSTIDNSLMIGDNIEADIKGAMNVGLRAIHCNFNKDQTTYESIVSVDSLLELKQYL